MIECGTPLRFRSRLNRTRRRVSLASVLVIAAALPVSAVEIIPRSEWGAKPPVREMVRHQPRQITIHHTATRQRAERSIGAKLRALQGFSQSEGKLADGRTKKSWADVPYHYYIDNKGRVAAARDVAFVGDTNTAYDPTGHIGIVLEGNFEVETLGPAQRSSLIDLLTHLTAVHGISAADIGVHRHHVGTACPGADVMRHLPAILAEVAAR